MFTPVSAPTPDTVLTQDLLNPRSFSTNYSWHVAITAALESALLGGHGRTTG